MTRSATTRAILAICIAMVAAAMPASATNMTDPHPFSCDDGSEVSVTYIAQPVTALVAFRGMIYVLKPQQAASGARFVAESDEGSTVSFWSKGDEALFELPGYPQRRCKALPR